MFSRGPRTQVFGTAKESLSPESRAFSKSFLMVIMSSLLALIKRVLLVPSATTRMRLGVALVGADPPPPIPAKRSNGLRPPSIPPAPPPAWAWAGPLNASSRTLATWAALAVFRRTISKSPSLDGAEVRTRTSSWARFRVSSSSQESNTRFPRTEIFKGASLRPGRSRPTNLG